MADRRPSPAIVSGSLLSPNRDNNEPTPSIVDRGRRGLTGRKGYNEPQPSSPSPSTSSRSASQHARSASIGHRRGHSNSSPLSPDFCGSRSSSRGASPSPRSRSRGLTGRKGYNADGLEGRKGYNDSGSNSGQPSPDPLESVRRSHHSRSASATSCSEKHSPSPSRAKFSPDPQVDYAPRTHVGMGGRKAYEANNGIAMARNLSDDGGRATHQQDPEDLVGLGINRHEGLTGRKGYNGAARNASPSPLRR